MPTITVKPKGYWKQNAALLAQQALSMSNPEIARAHNASCKHVRNQLHKLGIQSFTPKPQTDARKANLVQLLQTQSVADVAAAEGRTESALRQEMYKLGVKTPHPRPQVWEARKAQLAIDATSMTVRQLSEKYGCSVSNMQCVLTRMGIKAVKAIYVPRTPKAAPKPRAKRAAAPKPVPRNPKPLLKATPSRASIASRSKAPAQVIWPAHVKVQHITLPPPPASAPICASTMHSTYQPGQGESHYRAL